MRLALCCIALTSLALTTTNCKSQDVFIPSQSSGFQETLEVWFQKFFDEQGGWTIREVPLYDDEELRELRASAGSVGRLGELLRVAEESKIGPNNLFTDHKQKRLRTLELKIRMARAEWAHKQIRATRKEYVPPQPESVHITREFKRDALYVAYQPRVIQVVSDWSFICGLGDSRGDSTNTIEFGAMMMFPQRGTVGLSENQCAFEGERVVFHLEPKTYATEQGGLKTVPYFMDVHEQWLAFLKKQPKPDDLPQSTQPEPFSITRSWSTADGKLTTRATLVSLHKDTATLRKAGTKNYEVEKSRLSADDQLFLFAYELAQDPTGMETIVASDIYASPIGFGQESRLESVD